MCGWWKTGAVLINHTQRGWGRKVCTGTNLWCLISRYLYLKHSWFGYVDWKMCNIRKFQISYARQLVPCWMINKTLTSHRSTERPEWYSLVATDLYYRNFWNILGFFCNGLSTDLSGQVRPILALIYCLWKPIPSTKPPHFWPVLISFIITVTVIQGAWSLLTTWQA